MRLVELVSKTNVYISRGRKDVNIGVLRNIAIWVTKILRMFGLTEGSAASAYGAIGWGRTSAKGENELIEVGNMTEAYCWILTARINFFAA